MPTFMDTNIKPRISIAIPTYEMGGKGAEFLRHSFRKIRSQDFKDFEIVVADNSDDSKIEDVCKENSDLPIVYVKNPVKGMAQNSNAAIRASHGDIIKILYLDDYLFGSTALKDISNSFTKDTHWLVTGCVHTKDGIEVVHPHLPEYNDDIHKGENTIGSPSVLTIRNDGHLLFDETMSWLLDCDLYKRYHDTYGYPKILNRLGVVIRTGPHQMTNILTNKEKGAEQDYMNKKYE